MYHPQSNFPRIHVTLTDFDTSLPVSKCFSTAMVRAKFPTAFMACCKFCTEGRITISNTTFQYFSFYCCNWQCFVKYQQWVPYELHRPHSLSKHGIFYYQASSAGSLIISVLFCFISMPTFITLGNHLGFINLFAVIS